jgi:CRP-like cAMP-binding protein
VEAIDVRAPLPERRLAMLRALPLFSPLPSAALEQIARSLEPVQASKGEEVFRQGEPGDRFYIVAQGEVDVLVDGRLVRTQAAGDHFGEIALLREVPRTATVRARTDAELYALERDEFIAAVTGHPETAAAAETAIATRLAHARPRFASV